MTGAEDWILVFTGAALLAGYVAHVAGRRAHLPRVTLLLALGAVAGPAVFDVVPHEVSRLFPIVAQGALSMVGFMLGQHFTSKRMRETGRTVVVASVFESALTAGFVLVALVAAGAPLVLALLLAAVAPATAPAAVVDVTRELDADGPLTRITLGVVAIDDAWAILLFTLISMIAAVLGGNGAGGDLVVHGVVEVVGGVALGAAIGLPMAWVTGRVVPGVLTQVETLGFVLLGGGLAALLDFSYLITCMTMGAVVANRARHHETAFHAVEGALEPFLIVFFILAGFELDIDGVAALSVAGLVYVLARTLGKIAGGALGARLGGAPPVVRRYLGWTLLPQAGVALGLGLLLADRFPEEGAQVLQLLIGTTVVFEILGPIATRVCLVRAGERGDGS